jgi:hypothetical protein
VNFVFSKWTYHRQPKDFISATYSQYRNFPYHKEGTTTDDKKHAKEIQHFRKDLNSRFQYIIINNNIHGHRIENVSPH